MTILRYIVYDIVLYYYVESLQTVYCVCLYWQRNPDTVPTEILSENDQQFPLMSVQYNLIQKRQFLLDDQLTGLFVLFVFIHCNHNDWDVNSKSCLNRCIQRHIVFKYMVTLNSLLEQGWKKILFYAHTQTQTPSTDTYTLHFSSWSRFVQSWLSGGAKLLTAVRIWEPHHHPLLLS